MRTIYKYTIPEVGHFVLQLPRDARILSVQVQGEQPCLWALVDLEAPAETREFRAFGTGDEIPDDVSLARGFIGTFQFNGVSHLFEVSG